MSEGFRAVHVFEAKQDEWDRFESGYSAYYVAWLSKYPSDRPDVSAALEMAERQRRRYFRGYRRGLGFAYFGLVAV